MYVLQCINPDKGNKRTQTINKHESEFSDGYSQSTLIGINAVRQVRKLTWTGLDGDDARALAETLFELEHGIPFLYTYPGDEERQYKVSDVSFDDRQPTTGTITATFTESFCV